MRSQPELYLQFLLHVGGTDILKRYTRNRAYWLCVQAILDFFFSARERAEMCAELIVEPAFAGDPSFLPFLHEAKAEIRCRDIIGTIDQIAELRPFSRGVT